jgi:hypothetical protein
MKHRILVGKSPTAGSSGRGLSDLDISQISRVGPQCQQCAKQDPLRILLLRKAGMVVLPDDATQI